MQLYNKIMSGKTAAIIGSTGMIGTYLTELLLQDEYFSTVRLIVRRPINPPDSYRDKIEVKLVDFNDAESVKLALEGTDTLFCCIGTTQKNVKSDKELYRKVDYDIPVNSARFAKEAGCEVMAIVSAVGANSKSNNFYLKLKGEVEDALQSVGLRSVYIMQPSMLLGDRKENRPRERVFQTVSKAIAKILPSKYRPIHGRIVSAAMLNSVKKGQSGFFKYTYNEMGYLCIPYIHTF
jgi:uncharacterized protein YbjT (DUF2867 family)